MFRVKNFARQPKMKNKTQDFIKKTWQLNFCTVRVFFFFLFCWLTIHSSSHDQYLIRQLLQNFIQKLGKYIFLKYFGQFQVSCKRGNILLNLGTFRLNNYFIEKTKRSKYNIFFAVKREGKKIRITTLFTSKSFLYKFSPAAPFSLVSVLIPRFSLSLSLFGEAFNT